MMQNNLSAHVVRALDLGDKEILIWNELCVKHASLSSPFFSPHYIAAVAKAGLDIRVCILSRSGEICGFLPFQFSNRLASLVGIAEPVGTKMTDYFGLIADPKLQISSASLLRLARISHLGFSHLDESQLEHGLHAEQPRVGLRIRLPSGSDRPLESILVNNRKYLKDTERRERQLCNEVGPITFTFDAQECREELVQKLIQEKRSQYSRTQVSDPLAERWTHELLRELSKYRFQGCRGILSTLYAGDEWIALHFGILGNGTLQYWLPVYNPAMSRYAPGRQLIHKIIDSASTGPINVIDRGEGDTQSKRELANEEHQFFRGVWHDHSIASGITRGLQSLRWRLKR